MSTIFGKLLGWAVRRLGQIRITTINVIRIVMCWWPVPDPPG